VKNSSFPSSLFKYIKIKAFESTILPVVSHIRREKDSVFKNTVLREIFQPNVMM
jgi:hypothetical protein